MSYRVEVVAGGEWTGNALCFATAAEAQSYARKLSTVRQTRMFVSNDAVNYAWRNGRVYPLEGQSPKPTQVLRA